MNNESLRKHLAEQVMGWELKPKSRGPGFQDIYIDPNNHNFWLKVEDWNPPENIEQAFMCLDTFAWWDISHSVDDYECSIKQQYDKQGVNKSLPMAISLASARITGFEI